MSAIAAAHPFQVAVFTGTHKLGVLSGDTIEPIREAIVNWQADGFRVEMNEATVMALVEQLPADEQARVREIAADICEEIAMLDADINIQTPGADRIEYGISQAMHHGIVKIQA